MVAAAEIHILTGWKEISRYLDRGIRTVQRWEVELGLPIRRPAGGSRSSVLAIPSEVDAWLASRPLGNRGGRAPQSTGKIEADLQDVLKRIRQLRGSIRKSFEEFIAARGQIKLTMAKLKARFPLEAPQPIGNHRPRVPENQKQHQRRSLPLIHAVHG